MKEGGPTERRKVSDNTHPKVALRTGRGVSSRRALWLLL